MMNKLYFARNVSAGARRVGIETVVLSPADSGLFTLNEIASLIWEAADGQIPLDEMVVSTICTRFDVEPDRALVDAEAVVKSLAARGILQLSDEPILKVR